MIFFIDIDTYLSVSNFVYTIKSRIDINERTHKYESQIIQQLLDLIILYFATKMGYIFRIVYIVTIIAIAFRHRWSGRTCA